MKYKIGDVVKVWKSLNSEELIEDWVGRITSVKHKGCNGYFDKYEGYVIVDSNGTPHDVPPYGVERRASIKEEEKFYLLRYRNNKR